MILLGQHVGCAARVINNAMRLEQGRNHDNALRSGIDYLLKIVDVDSADTENRDPHIAMNSPDVAQPDWWIIRFRWRGEDGAKPDVISAFALCRARHLADSYDG